MGERIEGKVDLRNDKKRILKLKTQTAGINNKSLKRKVIKLSYTCCCCFQRKLRASRDIDV